MKNTVKYLVKLGLFILISGISIFGITFYFGSLPDFSKIRYSSLLIATIIALSSLYFEAEKLRFLIFVFKKKIRLKTAFEAMMGREFLSAITPFGSGGQPLEIYVLSKNGLKIGEGITFSYLETFYTLIVLFVFGFISLFFYQYLLESDSLKVLSLIGFLGMGYFVFFSYFCIYKPSILKKTVFMLIKLLKKIKLVKPHKEYRLQKKVVEEIDTFHTNIRASFNIRWYYAIILFLLTLCFWVLRFLAVYPILSDLGYENKITLLDFILYQMIITFANYFVITPGSSGSTDWLGAVLFATFIPAKDIPTFTTLWRFFSYHLIVLLCGISIFKIIKMFSSDEIKN